MSRSSKNLLFERYLLQRKKEMQEQANTNLVRRKSQGDQQAYQEASATAKMSAAMHDVVMQYAEKIFFAQSTQDMLNDYVNHPSRLASNPDDMPTVGQCTWIQFLGKPYDIGGEMPVEAMIFTHLYSEEAIREASRITGQDMAKLAHALETVKEVWSLELIDEHGTPVFYTGFNATTGRWGVSPFHTCPTHTCTGRFEPLDLCPHCERLIEAWGMICIISLYIRERYFAEDLIDMKHVYTTRRVRDPKKTFEQKTINVHHIFTLIDASVRIIPLERPPVQHPRGSWVVQSLEENPDSVVYIEKDVKRTYRHPRYVNMQGQEHVVHYPRVPRKKDRLEKGATKVIASKYE